ncbi:hypothetical protein LJC71_01085 [Desulfosarcina sp. OttesenSCG-928-A07]|nr:hypothetical protein [Desulfosarcina sp. OttesenSCG-928-A07]
MSIIPYLDGEIATSLIVGAIGSFVAGLLLPVIITLCRGIIGKILVIRKPVSINGVYDCKYYIPWKPYGQHVIYERIFIFQFGKKCYGYIINNTKDDSFRKLERPGIRLVGNIFLERYFIGWWSHPMPDDHTYGSFNMQIDPGGQKLEGFWTGESGAYHRVLGGGWVWEKQNIWYTIFHLIYFKIRGNKIF